MIIMQKIPWRWYSLQLPPKSLFGRLGSSVRSLKKKNSRTRTKIKRDVKASPAHTYVIYWPGQPQVVASETHIISWLWVFPSAHPYTRWSQRVDGLTLPKCQNNRVTVEEGNKKEIRHISLTLNRQIYLMFCFSFCRYISPNAAFSALVIAGRSKAFEFLVDSRKQKANPTVGKAERKMIPSLPVESAQKWGKAVSLFAVTLSPRLQVSGKSWRR